MYLAITLDFGYTFHDKDSLVAFSFETIHSLEDLNQFGLRPSEVELGEIIHLSYYDTTSNYGTLMTVIQEGDIKKKKQSEQQLVEEAMDGLKKRMDMDKGIYDALEALT